MTKKDAVAVIEPSSYPILTEAEAPASVATALAESGIGIFDLKRIRVPLGGATTWEYETLDGPQAEKDLFVVISVMRMRLKVWWKATYEEGTGKPPDCKSMDSVVGFGDNEVDGENPRAQHDCLTCPWDAFGSSRKPGSEGKDCQNVGQVFCFLPGSYMPTMITIPTMSLKPLAKYATVNLVDAGKNFRGVITRLTLEKDKNNANMDYSRIVPSFAGDLTPDQFELMKSLSAQLEPSLQDVDMRMADLGR